jgi:ATP-dependent Clp protease ATP-binding subunit ClpA
VDHLLLSLLVDDTVAVRALVASGIDMDALRNLLRGALQVSGPAAVGAPSVHERVQNLVKRAAEAARTGNQDLRPEHLLLAMLDDSDPVTSSLLALVGISDLPVRQNIHAELSRASAADPRSTYVA